MDDKELCEKLNEAAVLIISVGFNARKQYKGSYEKLLDISGNIDLNITFEDKDGNICVEKYGRVIKGNWDKPL